MTKSYPFNVLGEKRCIVCGKQLKKRIQEEHPGFARCFSCHATRETNRGHTMKGRK